MTGTVPQVSSPPAMTLRVPGKAMLIGEYAVLDGSAAVVAAIDSYARATLRPAHAPPSPFVQAAHREAAAALRGMGRALPNEEGWQAEVDTSAFSHGGHKLGLGSSAAVTVATVACCFVAAGLAVETAEVRGLIAVTAQRAHDIAQGVRGSGADILAATWGGLRRLGDTGCAPDQEPPRLALPSGIVLRLVGTSESASTAQLVARYRSAGSLVAAPRQQLAQAASEFVAGCLGADAARVLAAVHAAEAGYRQLGTVLDCPLVTAEHALIVGAARRVGGAAKPSGAGGGDLAVALLPSEAAAERFAAELPAPLSVLPLQLSEQGVHSIHEAALRSR